MKEIVAASDLKVGMFVVELDRPWLGTPFLMQGFLVEDDATLAQLRQLCRFVYVDWQRSVGEHHRAPVREPVAPVRRAGSGSAIRLHPDEAPRARRDFVAVLRWLRSGGMPPQAAPHATRPVVREETAREPRPSLRDAPEGEGAEGGLKGLLGRWFGLRGEVGAPPHARDGQDTTAAGEENSAAADDGPEVVAVEDELVDAAPTYATAQTSVRQLISDVQHNLRPDMERVRGSVEDMMHSVVRNPDALLWLTRLKRTDQYAYDHALDSSVLLMVFARFMGMEAAEMTLLGVAGLMQDIGKVKLPPRLLKKCGAITRLEREIFRTHVDYSLAILKASAEHDPAVLNIVARHHERYDGSGYPAGLEGDEIGLYGQMAGIVDCYSAMTRERPWGDALSPQEALEEINKLRDTWFSAGVVDAFIQCVGLYPVGTLVELNTGEVAVVIGQNRIRRLKPRVLVLLAPDKTANAHPATLDLLFDPVSPDGTPYAIRRALPPGAHGIDPQEFYLA
ncbi:HD-GYP domain-containing protein [Nitrogeniibacter mangrovi]|uniref:HD-GYP domain-containing protein n=1 Tax=Nitrogeniibacter mangrovi TaxID=2016596 RepID=A0A6C1B7K7_9RHOO|nr:HD-GYP domain-containing protein [Nitrogeniibacter mangrovi]QID18708.1 HD-GYP domain-containing protein [Nitrogeniibacter mangrovi]